MARRTLNRKDLRADFDAAERRSQGDHEELEHEDVTEEEAAAEEEAEAGEETGDEDEGDLDERPAKKKAAPKAAKPRARSRAAKIVRLKLVWAVFNNSNQRVATFDYPRRKEADELAQKLTTDKKNMHFVQPVKEPWEEKKDD